MRLGYAMIALVLAGCQAAPEVYDVPGNRSYDLNGATIWDRLVQAIETEGLSIVDADPPSGRLSAELADYQPRGWADCKRARVVDRHDDKNRRGRGRPVDRQLLLNVQVDETASRSTVNMRASFSERQINPFKNLPLRNLVPCRSTGELERKVFDMLDQG